MRRPNPNARKVSRGQTRAAEGAGNLQKSSLMFLGKEDRASVKQNQDLGKNGGDDAIKIMDFPRKIISWQPGKAPQCPTQQARSAPRQSPLLGTQSPGHLKKLLQPSSWGTGGRTPGGPRFRPSPQPPALGQQGLCPKQSVTHPPAFLHNKGSGAVPPAPTQANTGFRNRGFESRNPGLREGKGIARF